MKHKLISLLIFGLVFTVLLFSRYELESETTNQSSQVEIKSSDKAGLAVEENATSVGDKSAVNKLGGLVNNKLDSAEQNSLWDSFHNAQHAVQTPSFREAELPENKGARYFIANPAQDLTARFMDNGVRLQSGKPGKKWQGKLCPQVSLSKASRTIYSSGVRVEYLSDGMIEWYENRREGIEHGFTLTRRPESATTRGFALTIALDGLRAEKDNSDGIRLVDSVDGPVVSYSALKVWDADGKELVASMEPLGNTIAINVCDSTAKYPVTIDPLITSLEQKIVPTITGDGEANDEFGRAVAISGNTAVIGAYLDDTTSGSNAGSAYVFVRTGTTWSLQAKLTANDGAANDQFSRSVSIDNNTVLIGVPGDDFGAATEMGSAYVFERSGTTWSLSTKISASDGATSDNFGRAVSIFGQTALVGAPFDDSAAGTDAGSAYVFILTGGSWSQEAKIIAADAAASDNFGYSVSLGMDTCIVGSYLDDTQGGVNAGSAYVLIRSNNVWTQQTKIVAPDGAANDQFGISVSLSGETALVASAYDDTIKGGVDSGSASVFVRTNSIWSFQAQLIPNDIQSGDLFGYEVSLSGSSALIGVVDGDNSPGSLSGSAYVFARTGSAWTQQAKLVDANGLYNDQFGVSVALSGDTAVIGANFKDSDAGVNSGCAYVYERTGSNWNFQVQLNAGDGAGGSPYGDLFGVNVDIDGETVVIGSQYADTMAGQNSGLVYVLARIGVTWSFQTTLIGSDIEGSDEFAFCKISGNTIVVGAPWWGVNQGAAYVFVKNNGLWTQEAKLVADDGAAGDGVGRVAIDGDTVLFGGGGDDTSAGVDAGSLYVFKRINGSWMQEAHLYANDAAAGDSFGNNFDIEGDVAIIGAVGADTVIGSDSGKVYVYNRTDTLWSQQSIIMPSDGAASDSFGNTVAIDQKTALIGAVGDDTVFGTNTGSAYVFTQINAVWTEQAKLISNDAGPGDEFGRNLDLQGGTAIIGAWLDDTDAGLNAGSAYIFVRSGNIWAQKVKITAPDAAPDDNFGGRSVALDGNTILISSYRDSTSIPFFLPGMVSTSHGSVYIFRQFSSDLSDLALSSGTLSPAFSSSITNYTVSTANATASMTVTPMAVQANATIQVRVNGGTFANVASSSESAALALNVGSNIVEVQVTAQDGITKTTYSFEVTRRMAAENIMAARIDQRGKITRPAVLTAGGFGPVFAFQQGNLAVWQASGYGRIALFQVAQNAGLATSSHVATIESPDVTYDNPSFGHMLAFGPQLSLFAGNPYTWVSAPHDGRIYQYDISSMASPVFVRKFAESPHAAGYFGSNLAVDGDILITAQGPNGGGPQTRSGAFIYRINADKSLTLLKTQGRNADFMMPSGAAVSGDVCAMMFGTVSGNGTSAEAWVFRVTRVNGVATDVEGPVSIPFSNTTMDATRAQPSGGSSYHAVALKDNRLALGIYGDDVSASDNAVHLYNVSSTGVLTATQEAVLASPGLGASSRFGRRLLFINSGALLVSDPLATRSGTTAKGKVHLYEPSSPGQWSVSRVIEATTTNTAEAFGEFLALDDTQNDSFTMLAVGARTNADNLSADHDIYLFGVNSTNADLSSLTLSSGVLSPTFSSITTSYTASVDNTVSSITLTPTKAQANATTEVRVNNGTYSGVTSGALALNVGANTVEVRVTAQDGITQKIYTVMVTRGNPLRNLSIAQRAGTGLIDITYDLDVTAPVKITMEISSDGGATWAVPANTVSGAVGSSVAPGMGRSIVWNAGADWPQSYSSQMRFRLTVDDGYALIPPGSFVMGRTSGDTDANAPSVTVTVSAFYLQKTETTQAQWDEVRVWGLINGYTDLAVGRGKAANHPVVGGITWWDVVKWCNARSEKEGLIPCYTVGGSVMRTGTIAPTCNWSTNGYRLPSEAEWEKAARGGVSGQRFPWGDTITHSEANYFSSASFSYDVSPTRNSHPTYGTGSNDNTSPVVSFTANGYGLYDIIGNVEEWCWDWYGGSYYQDGATDPQGPLTGNNRVMRGGASGLAANYERCSHRTTNPPGTASKVGLRSARSINSGSATTDIASIDTRVPEIELKQPSGTGLVDGSTTSTWQALPIGALASPVTYLIRNVGEANLLNLGLSKSGTNAADFSISSLASTTLIPGQSTSFTVTFAPVTGVGGTRSATLQVASNDSDENPFDIILTGEAYSTTQDVDNDGMNDWGEYKLSTLGFDWQTPNTGLVSTYYENAAAAGLFTTSQIQNLNVGVPLLQRNPTTSEFTLTIGVNQSSDLKQWTPLPMTVPQTIINSQGKVEFRFTAPDNAAFFRLQTQPSP